MIKTIASIMGVVCALTPATAGLRCFQATEEQPRYGASFGGGSIQFTEQRKVYYSSDKVVEYENPYGAPVYVPSRPNSCVLEAAGNAIVYYDRLYDELVPNYAGVYNIFGDFRYGKQNAGIDAMFDELYVLTGSDSEGTTIDGFKSGVTSYVNNKGRSVTITKSTGSFYNMNYDYLKSQLEQEKMAIVFLSQSNVVPLDGILMYDGYDVVQQAVYDGHHAMLIYGFYEIYYYNTDGNLSQRDTYLYAVDGYGDQSFLSINYYTVVDDLYIVNIQ